MPIELLARMTKIGTPYRDAERTLAVLGGIRQEAIRTRGHLTDRTFALGTWPPHPSLSA